jgi:cysteine-rich repeat protein
LTIQQPAQLPNGANYLESGGNVVIEAETYSGKTPVGGQDWTVVADGSASGGEGIQAAPDSGSAGEATASLPVVSYNVKFVTTGTYNVWVRGRSLTGTPAAANSNSVHVGLNGSYTTADRISGFGTTWGWVRATMDGSNATVEVNSTGVHTISLKVREDGFTADKIYLTTSGTVPTGAGPAVSEVSNPGFLEHGGYAVFEAEGYVDNVSGASDTWTNITDGAASGGTAVQALPDTGNAYSAASATANAPRLDFPVTFTNTGNYAVWIRGRANPSGRTSSDSVHVGVDGAIPASSDDIGPFASTFSWVRATPSGNATLNIATPGSHTVSIYAREDGFVVDKVALVRTTITFTPSGTGPNETPIVNDPCVDGSQNGDEADVDCGGSVCDGCADGDSCSADGDCSSGDCDTVQGVCIPYDGCTDGMMAGGETGIDCGGPCSACTGNDVPFQEAGGSVAMEGESYARVVANGPTSWATAADGTASGSSYLNSTPDAGANFDPINGLTPRADFPVYFQTAGTYKVFVRGAGNPANRPASDTVHVGLDGQLPASSDRISGFTTSWGWRQSTLDGVAATITVGTPGLHSINVWVREDGFRLDKLVLTTGSAPTGTGPAQSSRGSCDAGYSGDPCTDINECDLNTDNCDDNATCSNTEGAFTCECDEGYSGDGVTCTDDDECDLGTDDCDENATCDNTPGGFTCTCNEGYTGDGTTCSADSVNECDLNTDNCDDNATCTDTAEGFLCTCNAGYEGNGTTCATNCTLNQTCVCGNNTVEGNEVCDDGNTTAGDGCRSDCRGTEVCGDGKTDTADGEQCDDGNTTDGDGCSSTCQLPPFEDVPPASVNSSLVALEVLCSLGNSNTGRKVGVDQLGRLYLAMRCGDNNDVYVTSSTDRGLTWSTPVATGLTGAEELAVEGGSANFAYVIAVDSNGEIELVRTLDAGGTWSSPSTLTTGAERNLVSTYVLSIDSAEDNVFVSVNHSGGLRVLRNFSRGIGSFDAVDVAQSSVFNDVILDKLTGWVLLPSDDPEFRIRTSSNLGVTFSAESNPAGSDFYTDWTGSGGYIYTSGVGTSLFRIPVSSPGTIDSVSGLPAANNWMRAIDADALGNVYVGTQRLSDGSITLDRYVSGAGSIDGADTRVIAVSGSNPQVVALPTNDGAVIAYNDSSGYIWVALEVY